MTETSSNNKVALVGFNSANVRIDNSNDSSRELDISANTDISRDSISGFNGDVKKNGNFVANFSCYGDSNRNLTINYQSGDPEEHCYILNAVHSFMDSAREFVSTNTIMQLSV